MRSEQRISYHHMLAQNFLRNISLDGSHSDTALKIFMPAATAGQRKNTGKVKHNNWTEDGVKAHEALDARTSSDCVPIPLESKTTSTETVVERKASDKEARIQSKRPSMESTVSLIRKVSSKLSLRRTGSAVTMGSSSGASGNGRTMSVLRRFASTIRGSTPGGVDEVIVETADGDTDPASPRNRHPSRSTTPIPLESSFADGKLFKSLKAPLVENRDTLAGMVRYGKQTADSNTPLRPFDFTNVDEISYCSLLDATSNPVGDPPAKQLPQTTSAQLSPIPAMVGGGSVKRLLSADAPSKSPTPPSADAGWFMNTRSISAAPISPPARTVGLLSTQASASSTTTYGPHVLNDPLFGPDIHKTTLAFPSFISSVLDYVNPTDLKKEINSKFKEQFPDIQLSYSKLQSIKREMKKICTDTYLDMLILAHAYVYFEKIVLKALVCKQNRKLTAGACLLLAAKLHDVRGQQLKDLIDNIEAKFRENRKAVLAYEIPVVVCLEFSLNLEAREYEPHYKQLLWQ